MKLIPQNITLENVKKSDYWNLISILVWNHYSEEKYQDDSKIEIKEDWYGKCNSGGSYSSYWDDPSHSKEVTTIHTFMLTQMETFIVTEFITIENKELLITEEPNEILKSQIG